MVIAYIKQYLRYVLAHASILELNSLQKEIDNMFRTQCDMLIAEVAIDQRVRDRINYNDACINRGAEIDREVNRKSLEM